MKTSGRGCGTSSNSLLILFLLGTGFVVGGVAAIAAAFGGLLPAAILGAIAGSAGGALFKFPAVAVCGSISGVTAGILSGLLMQSLGYGAGGVFAGLAAGGVTGMIAMVISFHLAEKFFKV